MRTISEMYKLSGGTDYRNLCAECYNCIREGKSFICRLYVEAGGNRRWESQWNFSMFRICLEKRR